ncbi:MAG: SDR family oxidoreductase [Gammaproteobacteria bacterium]|nr:SDR family oxidoreductase [Gammaproteobacteria bacterium]
MTDTTFTLVTGAFGGLGTAIVKRLLADGQQVIATDRRIDDADAWLAAFTPGERARIVTRALDVTRLDDVEACRDELAAQGHHVDRLVNNAGVASGAPPWSVNPKTFDIVMRVNLNGTFHLTRTFSEAMVRARYGRIVNLASLYAYAPGPGQSPYAAAKAAIVGYTRSIALDLAAHGVTCNVIAPGLIWHERLAGVLPDEEYAAMEQATPMKRRGEPREIAGTVSFLLSDDSSFITGQTLHVNGGAYLN